MGEPPRRVRCAAGQRGADASRGEVAPAVSTLNFYGPGVLYSEQDFVLPLWLAPGKRERCNTDSGLMMPPTARRCGTAELNLDSGSKAYPILVGSGSRGVRQVLPRTRSLHVLPRRDAANVVSDSQAVPSCSAC